MKPVLIVALLLASASISRAAPPPVGRQDLGLAWMRMERALSDHPPKPEVRKRLGDAFDVKTMAFFRGGFREVVRGIDSITAGLWSVLPSSTKIISYSYFPASVSVIWS